MAVQTTEEFLAGGSTTYNTVVEKLKDSDLKVRINGDLQTYVTSNPSTGEYTVTNNPTQIVLGAAAPSGDGVVHIYRETNVNIAAASFTAGSSIRAADLNAIHEMARFASVEHRNDVITDHIRDGQVTSAKIKDGTIVNADVSDSAAIDGSKIQASSGSNSGTMSSANFTKLAGIESGATADQTAAEIKSLYESNADVNSLTDAEKTKLSGIESGATADQTASEIKTLLQSDKLTLSEINETSLDSRYYTETEVNDNFYKLGSAEEIQSGEPWTAVDNKIATTAAIDARIIDLVDDVGGFVPIANEASFPSNNPDINPSGASKDGTIVSVKEASTDLVPSNHTVTIANGTADNANTVTITGVPTTIPSGFGFLVETTSTDHTYTFHRLVPKATEVTTVAGNISNINSAVSNASNINSVVSNASNINTVAGINSNVTTVANDETDIGLVAGSIANVNTTAGDIANVNTVATNITNVNTASTYLNNFLSLYLGELASDPVSDALGNALNEGDLYWNSITKQLRLYNGSVWQGITENTLEITKIATGGFELVYTASAGNNNIDLGGLAISGTHFSNESIPTNKMSLAKGSATYNLGGI